MSARRPPLSEGNMYLVVVMWLPMVTHIITQPGLLTSVTHKQHHIQHHRNSAWVRKLMLHSASSTRKPKLIMSSSSVVCFINSPVCQQSLRWASQCFRFIIIFVIASEEVLLFSVPHIESNKSICILVSEGWSGVWQFIMKNGQFWFNLQNTNTIQNPKYLFKHDKTIECTNIVKKHMVTPLNQASCLLAYHMHNLQSPKLTK